MTPTFSALFFKILISALLLYPRCRPRWKAFTICLWSSCSLSTEHIDLCEHMNNTESPSLGCGLSVISSNIMERASYWGKEGFQKVHRYRFMLYLTDIFIKHSITDQPVKVLPQSVQAVLTNTAAGWYLNNRQYCSQLWSLEVHDQGAARSGEGCLPGHRPLAVSSHGEGAREPCGVSHLGGFHPHHLLNSQRPQLLMPSPLGIWISAMNFGKTKHPVHSKYYGLHFVYQTYPTQTELSEDRASFMLPTRPAWHLVWLLVMFS